MAELVVPPLNTSRPIVYLSDATMQQPFRTFLSQVQRFLPIIGEGSPEGVVEAPQFSLYIDSLASTGSIEYRKMLPDIGGDTTMGWILI